MNRPTYPSNLSFLRGPILLATIVLYMLPGAALSAAPHQVTPINLDDAVASGVAKRALCEPSAALPSPWRSGEILVADNERKRHLFVFVLNDDGLRFSRTLKLPKPGRHRPADIEALAASSGDILVVGSHSRKKNCDEAPKRLRLRRLSSKRSGKLKETGFLDSGKRWKKALRSRPACVKKLFGDRSTPRADAVCEALVRAEEQADAANCTTINIEGAVRTADERYWLGLRAPLVDGRAILLRLAANTFDTRHLRFDRAVLVDLGGRGIRELALGPDQRMLWGIAGPELDGADPFQLWRVPLFDLARQGQLKPRTVDDRLPTSSEAMVVLKNRILVLVDGAEDKRDETRCERYGGMYFVPIP